MRGPQPSVYTFDLTVTDNCNYRCTYCFEEGNFVDKKFEEAEMLYSRLSELRESDWFKENYDLMNINFWGGEASMNMPLVKQVFNKFAEDDGVIMFIYSNASKVEPYYEMFERVGKKFIMGRPKLSIQFSYDGEPINSIKRPDIAGRSTTDRIREAYKYFSKQGWPVTLKATITPDMFKHLYEAYKDYKELTSGKVTYFPTIEYYHIERLDEDTFSQYKKELQSNLIKIAKEEKKRMIETGMSTFAWFNPNRALCSAGAHMSVITTDAELYKCHGCLYNQDDKQDHKVTTLHHEDTWLDQLIESSKAHQEVVNWIPEGCRTCEATFCIKCNAAKYSESDKDNYFDKWNDYHSQPKLCDLWKLNGKVVRAIDYIADA